MNTEYKLIRVSNNKQWIFKPLTTWGIALFCECYYVCLMSGGNNMNW